MVSSLLIDFEAFADGTNASTQIPGLVFSNATVLTAGASLNEFEFPPKSKTNVMADVGGSVVIDLKSPFRISTGSSHIPRREEEDRRPSSPISSWPANHKLK
jgi:hypothetical protein